jgi:hypothetical protein
MLTNYQVVIDRETMRDWELYLTMKSAKRTHKTRVWSTITGNMTFFQIDEMIYATKEDWDDDEGSTIWVSFAKGVNPMTEFDVIEFVNSLYPQTAKETLQPEIIW